MLCFSCTKISSVDLAYYGVSCAADWVSVGCGTIYIVNQLQECTIKPFLRATQGNPKKSTALDRGPLNSVTT